jgi:hypothetical protein
MIKRRRVRRPSATRQKVSPPPRAAVRSVPWRYVLPLLALVVIAVGAWTGREPVRRLMTRPPAILGPSSPRLTAADLEVTTARVWLPEAYVGIRDWTVPRRWVLTGYTRERATDLLREMPGAAERLQCDGTGCSLRPDLDAVLALTPEARSRLYTVLADMRENPQADDAFHRLREDGPFSAIQDLPPGAGEALDAFTWTLYGIPSFSDIAAVCARLADRAACNTFVRTMLSRPSATVRIRLDSPGVVDRAVAEFVPERQPEVRAMLQAAIDRGDRSILLSEFMPRWARDRVRTFPTPDEDWTNCFWSALNFVDRAPGPVGDHVELNALLGADFDRVTGPTRFGDVLVLTDARGFRVHAATVLVGGYLFTKNGLGHLQAWRVVSTAKVLADFPMTMHQDYWRARPVPPR